MVQATVSGCRYELDAAMVVEAARLVEAEPIQAHYVVVEGRRLPPKQLLAIITGLDRADFTTHQARSIFRRLGFGVYRRGQVVESGSEPGTATGGGGPDLASWPRGGAEAKLLESYRGRWIAQQDLEVLFDSDSPAAVVSWLRRNRKRAAVWKVPDSPAETGSSNVVSLG